jgi:hypothetical protein
VWKALVEDEYSLSASSEAQYVIIRAKMKFMMKIRE